MVVTCICVIFYANKKYKDNEKGKEMKGIIWNRKKGRTIKMTGKSWRRRKVRKAE